MKTTLLLLSILISPFAFGQHEISGTITDEFGPIPNVNIIVKNTKIGTSTNEKGLYSIKAKQTDTLSITHIGYESKDILIGDLKEINTQLKNYQILDEVLISAYCGTKTSCRMICCGFTITEEYWDNRVIDSEKSIKLYPNPSKDGIFTIKLLEDISEVNIVVADLTGRIIVNRTDRKLKSNVVVDLSNQPTGIYIINVSSNGTQIASKKAIRI